MDTNSILKNMIRIGECSSNDPELGTIKATFSDRDNMVSGDLPVVFKGGWDGKNSIPEPGDTVVCLFVGTSMSDGVCIGIIYDDDDPPGNEDQRGTWYEDGSHIYYDRKEKKIMVYSTGDIEVEAVGNVNVISGGVVDVTASDVNINASNVNITASNVVVNGNLKVNGILTN